MMELDLTPEMTPLQAVRVSPRLVAANHILALSSLELQQAIAAELQENPALELVEIPTCAVCGTPLEGSVCPRCLERQKGTAATPAPLPDPEERPPAPPAERDDAFDPLMLVAAEETLAERLLAELGTLLAPADMPIAEYLVGNLDERGYLRCSVEEAAYDLEVDAARVRQVLRQLQALEPVGIGARNLRECLLLQVAYLERLGVHQPYAREIIDEFLLDLGEHRFGKIAQALRIPTETVAAVWEFIKSKLNPHPAQGFSPTNQRDRDTRAMYVVPEVIITRKQDDFEIEVVDSKRFYLRIDPAYAQLAAVARRDRRAVSPDERKHVQEYINRAKLFISSIEQRRQTLYNITRCLVARQRDFLLGGIRYLKPLSRAAVAQELGIHESTVSRATAHKHVMLPTGEVVPFSHFFTPSLSVKDVIKELIEHESRPLTDAEIVARLREQGITIARRTVAKYRAQLKILPSPLR
jgi:RNA polymerase sigma-54 factor